MKSLKPTVAVVVPNLNQGRYLGQALESIIAQDNITYYIAVMDAGSDDNSVEVIRKYEKHIEFWRSHPDDGQAAAINEGVERLPHSDYVCWLNADDVFLEDGLVRMINFLETNKHFVAVYAKAYITDAHNNIKDTYPTTSFSQSELSRGCFICQPATLIRRQAWDEVDGVDPDFHMCMDYDLWWRLLKQGDLGYLQEYTACSRDHTDTKTRNNKDLHFNESFLLLKKNIGYVPWHWVKSYSLKYKRSDSFIDKIIVNFIAVLLYIKNQLY
ncbi:glycosyl transferase family 2 [Paenibacillus lautus]|uniref:glycosyltransferase n=1 Tax=Paenibacillus lautus TaxID=1401 RepID=UPI001B22FCC7|nr:glycosyltransferase [Paenibacillus lautus]GIP06883.1 glycosyl transferase family 2 [Paenibacillus lautus]